jgi:head-tail adaptor
LPSRLLSTDRPVPTGQRDKVVTVQELTESIGDSGFPVETWTTLAVVHARRDDISGDERFDAALLVARSHTRWETDYRPDLDPDEVDVAKRRRILYRARTYDVLDAQHIGRRDGIRFLTMATSA